MTGGVAPLGAASAGTDRRSQLEAALAGVRARIRRACDAAGRSTDEVTLIAVTKFFPASDVELLRSLGVGDIGENRDQEARAKVAGLRHRDALTVHFIGQLQSNKVSSVVRYADVVQSVDRSKLVTALDRAAAAAGTRPAVLVQVCLDEQPGRGGVEPAAAGDLAAMVARADHLELRGVMAVAPLRGDPAPAFARLREVADGIRQAHEQATWLSAGMSGDLEQAIAHGATHLRVGSAILGSRQPHR